MLKLFEITLYNYMGGIIYMKEQLSAIKTSAESALEKALDLTELENLRVKYLGKKGELTSLMKGMGKLTPEERPVIGGQRLYRRNT
mgnify:CR=1 FL=1